MGTVHVDYCPDCGAMTGDLYFHRQKQCQKRDAMTDAPFTETYRETLERWIGQKGYPTAAAYPALLAAAAAALAEIDRLDFTAGVRGNMLRYIAFVTTGDEAGDAQLGVDRQKAEIDRLTAPCRWTRDESFLDESDKWDTACDRAFTFIDGGPRENNYTHCPGCGRPVVVA